MANHDCMPDTLYAYPYYGHERRTYKPKKDGSYPKALQDAREIGDGRVYVYQLVRVENPPLPKPEPPKFKQPTPMPTNPQPDPIEVMKQMDEFWDVINEFIKGVSNDDG